MTNSVVYDGDDAILTWEGRAVGRVDKAIFEIVMMLLEVGEDRHEVIRQLVHEGYEKSIAMKIVLHAEGAIKNKEKSSLPLCGRMKDEVNNADPCRMKRVGIPRLATETVCGKCGHVILKGEEAVEIMRERKDDIQLYRIGKARWERLTVVHRRCVPEKYSQVENHDDIFRRCKRMPGSFENGKRK